MTAGITQTIAVFAATGGQGGAVTDALLAQGATVRALLRDITSDKAKALAGRGVELAQVDVHDAASLATALTGIDAFWFMTTPPGGMQNADTEGEALQGIALADAAFAARVPHVVFNSVGGAERGSHVPHFESKYRVEQHLAVLGVPVTVVRPVFFMDNFRWFQPTGDDGSRVLRLPLPEGIELQMVATRDVGAIAAAALLDPAAFPKAIEIAGDALTGSGIAAAFAGKTGTPVSYEALPLSTMDGQDDMQAMFRWFAETPGYAADIEQVRSIAPGTWTFEQWLGTVDLAPAS